MKSVLAAAASIVGLGPKAGANAVGIPNEALTPSHPTPAAKQQRRNPAVKLLSGICGGGNRDSRIQLPLVPEDGCLPTQWLGNYARAHYGRS